MQPPPHPCRALTHLLPLYTGRTMPPPRLVLPHATTTTLPAPCLSLALSSSLCHLAHPAIRSAWPGTSPSHPSHAVAHPPRRRAASPTLARAASPTLALLSPSCHFATSPPRHPLMLLVDPRLAASSHTVAHPHRRRMSALLPCSCPLPGPPSCISLTPPSYCIHPVP
jgi:hypothetical protein